MKKILLSSAAIVGFAGAAAADVDFSGSAKLGYNDKVEGGVYTDLDFDIAASAELNNGWTAGASAGIEVSNLLSGTPGITTDADYKIFLESDMGGLYFGDYSSAVDQLVSSPEGLTDGMVDFDDDNIGEDGQNLVLKGKFGSIEAAVSAVVLAGGNTDGLTAAVKGEFGNVDFSLGYVDGYTDLGGGDLGGDVSDAVNLNVGTTLGGADVKVGFAKVGAATNYGIEVGYPVGPVALTVWYATGDQADNYGLKAVYEDGPVSVTAKAKSAGGTETFNLEGTYDMGNGLLVGAGYVDGEGTYLGAKYDLGGGATFLAAYADADTAGGKDIGDAYDGDFELKDGLTLEVSLSF